mmetsp:Transcript_51748/g.93234  ORF Transcript_51748/g.93234 Transcript_51748/m.93234 type:complete len:155 (+) Transcript_51748:66-530(+)
MRVKQEGKVADKTPNLTHTRLCTFYPQGKCTRGEWCSFAHDPMHLKQLPDFHKTRFCQEFLKLGLCKNGSQCTFAHTRDEKRSGNAGRKMPAMSMQESWAASPTFQKVAKKEEEEEPVRLVISVKNTFLHFEQPTWFQAKRRATSAEPRFSRLL